MAAVLVQGGNRGLGLSFVKILAARNAQVIATCRNPAQAEDLKRLKNVDILQVKT